MADTKISALTAASAAALTDEVPVNQGGTTKKSTVQKIADLLFTRIGGSSGAAGPYKTLQRLTSNSSDQSSTASLATVMTTTGLSAGTYTFTYTLIYQTAATGTGIGIVVDYSGTSGQFATTWTQVDTSATASTAVGSTVSTTAAGGVLSAKCEDTKGTLTTASISVGVVTANSDVMATLTGVIVVTGSGDLTLKMRTEVNSSAVRMMANSCLELTKVA